MNRIITLGAMAAMAAVALCSCKNASAQAGCCEGETESCGERIAKIIEDVPTIQQFSMDAIPEADLIRIANAGVNSPSAMNKQPWHFTVLSNADVIAQMAEDQKSSMKNMPFPPKDPGAGDKGPGAGAPGAGAPPAGAPGAGPGAGAPGAGPGDAPQGGPKPSFPGGKGPKSGLGDTPVVILISCTPGSEFDAGLACESMNDMANVLGYGTKIVSSITLLFRGENKTKYYEQFQIPEGQEIVAAILLGKVNPEGYDAVSSATPRTETSQVVSFVK